MTNDTLTWATNFVSIYGFWYYFYHTLGFISESAYLWIIFVALMENGSNNSYYVCNSSVIFRGKSSSELNLIFIYFSA